MPCCSVIMKCWATVRTHKELESQIENSCDPECSAINGDYAEHEGLFVVQYRHLLAMEQHGVFFFVTSCGWHCKNV